VGILKLSLNDLGGIVDLEKAIEIDPNLPMAKMALATAYTQNKQYEKALALAEKWKQEAPFKIDGYNLAAKVYLLQNKTVEAEAELQQSLNIEPNNIYALIYYANQSFRNEQYEQAISYLERILEKTPENSAALSLYYIVHSKLGKPLVAVNFIEKQFTEHKDNQNLKLLYAQVLHDQKKFEKVINLLKETQSPEADLPAKYWIILGDSFLKTNQLENALTVYNKFTIYHPNYRTAWLGKIKTLELQENYLEALVTTDKALKLAPNDSQFNVLRAYYQILTKQFDKARTQLAKLNKEQLENPLVKVIKGQLLLQEGSYKEGLDNLLAYYQVQPSSPLAHLIFNTYIKLKQSKQALQFLSRHVMDYPKDIASKITLAEFSIDYAPNVAIDNYQQLVKLYPDNLTFLNNLAWVLYLEGKYKAADTIITRALKIKDDIPQLLDTAGLIKFKQGDIVKAEELLKRAMLLSPNDSSILAHYNEVKKVL
jgi:putative PEP-CTERM system TPR-repeat lipoprotein